MSPNVRSRRLSRRAILAAAALPLFLIAMWVRTPALPRTSGPTPQSAGERAAAMEGAIRALQRELDDTRDRLQERASSAFDAPQDPEGAFAFLSARSPQREGESIVLFDKARPLAWSGEMRIDPDSITAALSVSFTPFYTTLNVVRTRGTRRAVASAVISTSPPADELTGSVDSRLSTTGAVSSYDFAPATNAAGGPVVLSVNGRPLLRAAPVLATAEEVRFRQAAMLRARGAIALMILVLVFLFFAWRDRHSLTERLLAVGAALVISALIPWNSFSNTSRIFDPAYYFSRLGGPLTANAGALCISSSLLLLAVFALIRAQPRGRWPRAIAGLGALVTLGIGIPFASNIVRGVGQPPWGSTPGLWLAWEVPLFVFLFAVLLAAYWMLRMALARPGEVSFRASLVIAAVSAIVALGGLWSTTSKQRMQLAEEDVAALGHVDDYAVQLTRRLVSTLAQSTQAGSRADLLKVYAASDLADAEYPAILASWDQAGNQVSEFAVVPAEPDSDAVSAAVKETLATRQPVVKSILGPTGVQVLAAVAHTSGGAASVLVMPRTRLLGPNPYAALLGMAPLSGGDPPYVVALADLSPSVAADTTRVQWRRVGDELHGDRLISTSAGTVRAHVEIDLRSIWARGERGALV
ncbi:MAG TPA: hypothetical protein VLJ83_01865, partial [Gemmatimonadaceae bacterium]|nr:hypothetical protein [Gemmatimonadaceae bacterium]